MHSSSEDKESQDNRKLGNFLPSSLATQILAQAKILSLRKKLVYFNPSEHLPTFYLMSLYTVLITWLDSTSSAQLGTMLYLKREEFIDGLIVHDLKSF